MAVEIDIDRIGSINLLEEIELSNGTLISACLMDDAKDKDHKNVFFAFDNTIVIMDSEDFDELAEIMHNYHISMLELKEEL